MGHFVKSFHLPYHHLPLTKLLFGCILLVLGMFNRWRYGALKGKLTVPSNYVGVCREHMYMHCFKLYFLIHKDKETNFFQNVFQCKETLCLLQIRNVFHLSDCLNTHTRT